jgi:hypothetical protein
MIAADGSRWGTAGTSTSPAPNRPRRDRTDPPVPAVVESDRVDDAATAGARPHKSQKPSSMAPPHPGRTHLFIEPSPLITL